MGRPRGSVNKRTAATQDRLAAAGTEMPLAYMLRVMGDRSVDNERRDDMAKAAAPYVHSKLTTVTGKDNGPIEHRLEVTWKDPE